MRGVSNWLLLCCCALLLNDDVAVCVSKDRENIPALLTKARYLPSVGILQWDISVYQAQNPKPR